MSKKIPTTLIFLTGKSNDLVDKYGELSKVVSKRLSIIFIQIFIVAIVILFSIILSQWEAFMLSCIFIGLSLFIVYIVNFKYV